MPDRDLPLPQVHAIIPAGGAGSRLWPLSRQEKPKFLLDLLGNGRTLLQETFDRLKEVSLTITVVTGAAHYEEVCRQLPDLTGEGPDPFPGEILVEPSPRDSMAAIGLAAYIIRGRYGDEAIIGSFAADHAITSQRAFNAAVENAVAGARLGYLTTWGIVPDAPSTAYGYIEPAPRRLAEHLYQVERFVEKPAAELAEEYVARGYLWNAGIFVFTAEKLAAAMRAEIPEMDRGLSTIAAEHLQTLVSRGEAEPINEEQWAGLKKIAIDYALAEPLAARGEVAVVETSPDLGWSDVGDFRALRELRVGGEGNLVLAEKHVRVLGLANVGVIDTQDALLVLDLDDAQAVREAVEQLREEGLENLL